VADPAVLDDVRAAIGEPRLAGSRRAIQPEGRAAVVCCGRAGLSRGDVDCRRTGLADQRRRRGLGSSETKQLENQAFPGTAPLIRPAASPARFANPGM